MRSVLNCHATANKIVCRLNFFIGVSQMRQQVESDAIQLLIRKIQNVFAKIFSQHKFVECETDIKYPRKFQLDFVDHIIGEPFSLQRISIDIRRRIQTS